MRGTILKNFVSKYYYKDSNPNPNANPKKKFVDPNPNKMSSDPQHWFQCEESNPPPTSPVNMERKNIRQLRAQQLTG
jgi:hypothetical protein